MLSRRVALLGARLQARHSVPLSWAGEQGLRLLGFTVYLWII